MRYIYRTYEEHPYIDMRANSCRPNNLGCGFNYACNNCHPNNFPWFPQFPSCNNPCTPNIPCDRNCHRQNCSCDELIYLLSGIIIGKTLC